MLALRTMCCQHYQSTLPKVTGLAYFYYATKSHSHNVKLEKPASEIISNYNIRSNFVMVVDKEGKQLGVMDLSSAVAKAKEQKMDLLCIGAKQNPPVCKIYSLQKYIYQQQGKNKPVQIKTKEIRFSSKIEEHDINNKMTLAHKFLMQMMNVKITIQFDQLVDQDLAEAMLDNLYSRVSHFTKREVENLKSLHSVSVKLLPIPEKVKIIKANPDKTPEQLSLEEDVKPNKKKVKELAKDVKQSQPTVTHSRGDDKSSSNESPNLDRQYYEVPKHNSVPINKTQQIPINFRNGSFNSAPKNQVGNAAHHSNNKSYIDKDYSNAPRTYQQASHHSNSKPYNDKDYSSSFNKFQGQSNYTGDKPSNEITKDSNKTTKDEISNRVLALMNSSKQAANRTEIEEDDDGDYSEFEDHEFKNQR